jgi:hypothetical protein
MKITKTQSRNLAKKLNINLDIIDFEEWNFGLNVELEHGKKFGSIVNITNNNLEMTAKIAIAHLLEFPDYYKRLKKMEEKADIYWKKRIKPNIFVK